MDSLAPLIEIIRASGPVGAVLAGVIVAGVLALIIFARTRNLFAETRTAGQATQFQAQMLVLVTKLTETEDTLRRRLSELETENRGLSGDLSDMKVTLSLIRNQRRRLLDYLRAIKEGRMLPEQLHPLDLGSASP